MTKDKIPAGAKANRLRKLARIKIAKDTLKKLSPTMKFQNPTAIYEFIAGVINTVEEAANNTSKKGPCSRTGLLGVQEVRSAVEHYWVTGALLDENVDLYQALDATAKKKLMDKDLEISNLTVQLEDSFRFLNEAERDIENLKKYIESNGLALEDKSHESPSEDSLKEYERKIEDLCQAIFNIEVWADVMLERTNNGALRDTGFDKEVVPADLMSEYHRRVPLSKLQEAK